MRTNGPRYVCIVSSEYDCHVAISMTDDDVSLKLYNLVNITGSALVAIFYAIAVGIVAGVGHGTDHKLLTSYRVLMGYFGAITVLCTLPFFIVHKHRPGQQLPKGTGWLTAGPKYGTTL